MSFFFFFLSIKRSTHPITGSWQQYYDVSILICHHHLHEGTIIGAKYSTRWHRLLRKLTTYCPVPGYSDEIVHVYFAEVDKIKRNNLYNKLENEEIKIFKLSLNQLMKINDSKTIQNVLTKISIYEYLKKIKKN